MEIGENKEAEADLPRLGDRVVEGEEIVIARCGRPRSSFGWKPGRLKGRILTELDAFICERLGGTNGRRKT